MLGLPSLICLFCFGKGEHKMDLPRKDLHYIKVLDKVDDHCAPEGCNQVARSFPLLPQFPLLGSAILFLLKDLESIFRSFVVLEKKPLNKTNINIY